MGHSPRRHLIAGFPIALVTAWFFEITPEGVKRAEEVDLTQPHTVHGAWIYIVLVGAAVSIASVCWPDENVSILRTDPPHAIPAELCGRQARIAAPALFTAEPSGLHFAAVSEMDGTRAKIGTMEVI